MIISEHAKLEIITKSNKKYDVDESYIVEKSLTTTQSCSSGGGIPAGSCNAGTMSVSFRAPAGMSKKDLFMAKIKLYVWYGSDDPKQIGEYNVTSSTKNGNVYTVSASDNIVLLDENCYSAKDVQDAENGLIEILGGTLRDPATILSFICNAYSVPHLNHDENVEKVPDSGNVKLCTSVSNECSTESVKDFASYIAEYLGAFIVADENGKVRFCRLGDREPDIEINSSNIAIGTYQRSPYYVFPSMWRVCFDSGFSNYWYASPIPVDAAPLTVDVTNNPFWQYQEDKIPSDIYAGKTTGMIALPWDYIYKAATDENGKHLINPFSATVYVPYMFRVCDLVTIKDPDTNEKYRTYITDVTWTFRGGQTISCAGEDTRTLSVSRSRSMAKRGTDYSKYLYRKQKKSGESSNTTYKLTKTGHTISLKGSDGSESVVNDSDTVYTHPAHTSHSKGMYKFANDGLGHVSDAENVTKQDIVDLGIPGQDTTYTGGNSDYGDVYIDENNTIFVLTAVGKRTDTNLTSEIFNDYENNTASGVYSRASGTGCHTSGNWASSGGALCNALGDGSFAYGYGIKTSGYCQTAFGQYNENGNYIFEIGNGSSNTKRSNALSVDANGDIFCYGDETSLNEQIDANTKKLSGIDDNANNYVHPSYTARTGVPTAKQTPGFGSTFSVTQPVSDATGHITAMNSRTVTIPNTAATTSAAGLMSATDKTKLDGIATGANKTVVDTALSSTSTNPVQNKVVKAALDGKAPSSHTHSQYYDSSISRTANTVLAAPNGSAGSATFRKLVLADIPTGQWNAVAYIKNDGVMEIGKYIDFHISSSSTADYDVRITAESTGLTISGTTKGTFSGSLSGNASTATKLKTARTLTIGSTGKSFDGSANVSWTLAEIGAAAASHTHNQLHSHSSKSTNYGTLKASSNQLSLTSAVGMNTKDKTYTYNNTSYSGSVKSEVFNDYTNNMAAGDYAHVEGSENKGLANCCHVEGWKNIATGLQSHAGGTSSTAYGEGSFVHGYQCTATTAWSVAMGSQCTSANSNCAFTFGWGLTNLIGNSTVVGQWNNQTKEGYFVVGKGTSSAKANAFRVASDGKTYATGAYSSTGADYAEMFEWMDGNPDEEDRRGRFVTLDGEKIKFAESADDDIIGVVSAAASIVGDAYEDNWNGMYLTDIFGGNLYDDTIIDEDGNKHVYQTLNPDYDPDAIYVPRSERPEWDAVGMMGKLVVVDDGTCKVNEYCIPTTGGIATESSGRIGYRVLARIDDTHVKILMR